MTRQGKAHDKPRATHDKTRIYSWKHKKKYGHDKAKSMAWQENPQGKTRKKTHDKTRKHHDKIRKKLMTWQRNIIAWQAFKSSWLDNNKGKHHDMTRINSWQEKEKSVWQYNRISRKHVEKPMTRQGKAHDKQNLMTRQ